MMASLRSLASIALPAVALLAAGGVLWTLHVLRLRSRERRLLAIIERMVRRPGTTPGAESAGHVFDTATAGPASLTDARVLVVARAENRDGLLRRLEALGIDAASADSAWSARVACREALEAGAPYNLVLLDAAAREEDAAGWLARFEAGLAWGVRVALVRGPLSLDDLAPDTAGKRAVGAQPAACAGAEPPAQDDWVEESVGPDEDPDRRGRAGFAPAAAADPSALGLRGPRRE